MMLQVGQRLLEAEAQQIIKERETYMAQNCPSLSLSGTMEELQVRQTQHVLLHLYLHGVSVNYI